MGYTLEERVGITMENIKMLANIAETTGVCITEHDSLESFQYSFLETLSTETLEAISEGRINGLTDKMMYAAGIILKDRYAVPDPEEVDTYLEEELIALELKDKDADQ